MQRQLAAGFERYRGGNLKGAGEIAQQVLMAAPRSGDGLHLLGLVALGQGALAQAAGAFQKALEINPGHAAYWSNFGNVLRRMKRGSQALGAYDKAIELDPRFLSAYLNRGTLYEEAGQGEKALEDFRALMALAPGQREGYGHAVRLLLAMRQVEEAVNVNLQALRHLPEDPVFLSGAAHGLERLSRLDEALSYAERALAAAPGSPAVVKIWAFIKRRLGDLDGARQALEALDFSQVPPGTARLIHAELGLIYDRQDVPEKAIMHFEAQNRIAGETSEGKPERKQTYLDQVSGLRKTFTAPWVSSWTPVCVPVASPPPVFLVGFPRSGTTLLDQMLDAHSGVQVFEEFPVLIPVRDQIGAREGGYPGALADLEGDDIAQLRTLYFDGMAALGAQEGKVAINKLPLNLIHGGLIARVFPEAKFILALRHPAGSVLSCFMQDFQLNASMANFLTLKDSVHLYDQVMRLWQAYEALLPLDAHRVKYEELVDDQERVLRGTLKFLGVGWEASVLDHVAHAKERPAIMTPSRTQVMQPLYRRATDRWRAYLPWLEPFMADLSPHLRYFGYEDHEASHGRDGEGADA